MAQKKLEVVITGDAKGLRKAFGDADRSAGSFGTQMGKVGKLVAVGLGAGALAAGALAVAGVKAATEFQTGMNEVFTLLPGISGGAMEQMSQQVKDFSVEFGVLPEETIPALYQALSAGVPQDNVFDFLETAQKAARGGVTDLTTAVDGISSVVNAYGAEVISAGEASDLMFTAVKNGKTTFEELSASLSNVNPIASSLGVNFGDVTAALATMTAQGIPTAQATTQLRQAFVDLSKDGSKTSDVFQKISGTTFKEFIAAGGNTQDALQLLSEYAAESGLSIADLFGSVEAGQAALALTGGNAEAFGENLEAMGQSAGATDEAFQQMNKGLGPLIDKAKAWAQVMLIDLGEKLAPHLERLGKWLSERIPAAIRAARDWFERLSPAIDVIKDGFTAVFDAFEPIAKAIGKFIADNPGPVFAAIAVVVGFVLAAAFWSLAAAVNAAFLPIYAVIAVIALLAAGLAWAYQNVGWFHDAVDAVGRFLRDVLWPAIVAVATWVGERLVDAFNWAAGFITGTVIPTLQSLWHWFEDNILPTLSDAATVVTGTLVPALSTAASFITGTVVPAIQTMWSWLSGILLPAIGAVAGHLIGVLGGALSFVASMFQTAWAQVSGLVSILSGPLSSAVSTVASVIGGYFSGVLHGANIVVSSLAAQAQSLWSMLSGIADAARAAAAEIRAMPSKIPGLGLLSPVAGLLGKAEGGPVTRNTPYIVGEVGPELFVPNSSGTIIPNDRLTMPTRATGSMAATPSGGGDTYVSVHVAGSVRADRDLATVIRSELIDIGRRTGKPVLAGLG